jgi:hypothetical protein
VKQTVHIPPPRTASRSSFLVTSFADLLVAIVFRSDARLCAKPLRRPERSRRICRFDTGQWQRDRFLDFARNDGMERSPRWGCSERDGQRKLRFLRIRCERDTKRKSRAFNVQIAILLLNRYALNPKTRKEDGGDEARHPVLPFAVLLWSSWAH